MISSRRFLIKMAKLLKGLHRFLAMLLFNICRKILSAILLILTRLPTKIIYIVLIILIVRICNCILWIRFQKVLKFMDL